MSTKQFSDADRLGPDNPGNKEFMQQRGVETCGTCSLYPCGCDGYVHKDNPRPCGVSVSGVDGRPQAPVDGGEFEREAAIQKELWFDSYNELAFLRTLDILISAHNADRAADRRRISALMTLKASLEGEIAVHRDKASKYKESIRTLDSEREANGKLTERIAELEATVNDLSDHVGIKDTRIAKLEAQLAAVKMPRVMKRDIGKGGWTIDNKFLFQVKASQVDDEWHVCEEEIENVLLTLVNIGWLELEPTPTLPGTSDDMSSLVGDGD